MPGRRGAINAIGVGVVAPAPVVVVHGYYGGYWHR